MSQNLLTVDQAAALLKLHPKTVLRYIRDGRLPATRVGKSYRIARSKLESFAGAEIAAAESSPGAQATCIVEMPDLSAEEAQRMAAFVQSAAMAAPAHAPSLRVQSAFDPLARTMKLVIIGGLSSAAVLLEMLDVHVRGHA